MAVAMWFFLCVRKGDCGMNQTFMKEKKVIPLVLSMALPMVLSMAVNSLYNIVDSYFVAKLSEDAMTALSLVFPAQNLLTAVSVGFGIGVNAQIAYFLGAKDQDMADRTASQGILFSVLHGVMILFVFLLGMPWFLGRFTSRASVLALGIQYSNVVFWFSVVVSVGITYEKIFQAVGRMKETMICMMLGFVTNILLDPLLIFGIGPFPELGMRGAAVATGMGQVLTFFAYVFFDKKKPLPVNISFSKMKPSAEICKKVYGVGGPATLNMALPSFLITALNGMLSVYGETYVLVLGIYYKLQTFIYLPTNGVLQGIRPLVGYNYGAKEYRRVEKIYRFAMVMTAGIMFLGMGGCLLIPKLFMSLFASNPQTIAIGTVALRIISLGFLVSATSITYCGTLEGLGEGMPSLVISLLRYTVIMIPVALLLSHGMGAVGVWIAFPVTEFAVALVSYLFFYKIWKKKKGN